MEDIIGNLPGLNFKYDSTVEFDNLSTFEPVHQARMQLSKKISEQILESKLFKVVEFPTRYAKQGATRLVHVSTDCYLISKAELISELTNMYIKGIEKGRFERMDVNDFKFNK